MKKTLLLILMVGVLMHASAQDYYPFDTANISWTEREILGEPPETTYYHYFVEGDTVIDDQKYFKIFEDQDSAYSYMGAFREENRIVYYRGMDYWMFEPDSTVVLYDFTKDVGDTVYTGPYAAPQVIQGIDSVMVDGAYHKRYSTNWNHQWIEGVGSLAGFLYPITEVPIETWQLWMSCFKKNGEVIYLHPEFSDCTTMVGLPEDEPQGKVRVYPNPVTSGEMMHISAPRHIVRYQVMDISGRIIEQEKGIKSKQLTISTPFFGEGVYVIRLSTENREYVQKFLVKRKN
ncbi:MAG TPA: T9SS type A sorting domain-containing protein [Salinivirga sp.]|uniref:T9SS type A sorting domain-containing protein n=1 Tax=Salinivirga sp. TaxID=1970192 RepID=UPI002B4953B9|nr:T9SS type A sorting domain-containing protein [Salinivirga sp.]HKK59887.1 T9SS type A sorting domain-containing protein [Salinivirga sp.]